MYKQMITKAQLRSSHQKYNQSGEQCIGQIRGGISRSCIRQHIRVVGFISKSYERDGLLLDGNPLHVALEM